MDSKLHDAILGLAIGDALGVPYEFKKRGTFLCTEMVGYGTHNQPEGTWSDDTSMVLATLDTLEAALWAVSHKSNNADKEKSFRNDLLDAVNLGQDTDTVGAVAGGLAGIIYGLDEVSDWVEKLQNREELERYLW